MQDEVIKRLNCETDGCPSGLSIHAFAHGELSGGARAAVEAAVASCAGCRSRLDEANAGFGAIPDAPRDRMLAAIRGAVDADAISDEVRAAFGVPRASPQPAPGPSWGQRFAAWFGAVQGPRLAVGGAILAVILLVLPQLTREGPGPDRGGDGVRLKGAPILHVLRVDGTALTAVNSGDVFSPGDTLVFEVSIFQDGHSLIVGEESDGQRYASYPASGTSTPSVAGPRRRLERSVVLDDSDGEERLYLVHCPTPFTLTDVSRGKSVGRLSIPAGCTQSAFVLRKGGR